MPGWETATDWDSAQAEDGVVHESTANMDHNDAATIKKGYAVNNPPFASNLVFWWPFHEDSGTTAHDVIGTNDGTINGATVGQPGVLGTTCYDFDGTDDIVTSSSPIPTVDIGSDHSISFWVNPDTTGVSQQLVILQKTENNRVGISINRRGNEHLQASVRDSSTFYTSSSGPVTASEGWIHATFVFDSANLTSELYLNSEAQTGSTDANFSGLFDGTFRVGRLDNGAHQFDGQFGELMVFDRQLTSTEVQTLYDVVWDTSSLTTAKQTF